MKTPVNLIVSTLSDDLENTFRSLKLNCKLNHLTEVIILIQKSFKNRTKIISYNGSKITFIFSCDQGLSKSRNYLLQEIKRNRITGLIYICDSDTIVRTIHNNLDTHSSYILLNDLEYDNGYQKTINIKHFESNIKLFKKIGACKVVSSQISIFLNSPNDIDDFPLFDLDYGIGSDNKSSEENVFISDCIDKNISIKKLDQSLVYKNYRSPSRYINGTRIYTKIPAYRRIFGGQIGILIFILFFLKKRILNA